MNYYNNKAIELLAPAGNFEIFKEIINTKADAFYFGGKKLNMRMHRSDFNFTDEEIVLAIEMAHDVNKKIYITVNNLFNQIDLDESVRFLKFLESAKPDGIIVQDLSIINIIKENNLNLECHSSVMMNVHNLEMVKFLKNQGFTRLVTSREVSLADIKYWKSQVDIEFEYFAHGDMCVAHGSQCLYSSLLFGKSSNRGLCMKPCRWDFKIDHQGKSYQTEYPLAVKDMNMYEHIPELIESGVTCFKLEGRMRTAEYTISLINAYADSIKRYIEASEKGDVTNYVRDKDSNYLFEHRKRDFSTAYAFGKPGLENINRRYEGTGYFYSHGRVFSKPVKEHTINPSTIKPLKDYLYGNTHSLSNIITQIDSNLDSHGHEGDDEIQVPFSKRPKLSVKIKTKEQFEFLTSIGINEIIFDSNFMDISTIHSLVKEYTAKEKTSIKDFLKIKAKLIFAFPQMTFDNQLDDIFSFFDNNPDFTSSIDGFLITNIGQIAKLQKYNLPIFSDYSLNVYNYQSAIFLNSQNVSRTCLSIEMNKEDFRNLINNDLTDKEVIVCGSPTVMLLEHDLYDNVENKDYHKEISLINDIGTSNRVLRDSYGRNHILPSHLLYLLPLLSPIMESQIKTLRLEIQHEDDLIFSELVIKYKGAITAGAGIKEKNYESKSFGTLSF